MADLTFLDPYQPALISLALLCLIPLLQAFLAAPLAFVSEEQQPGLPLHGDHKLLSFRVLRTHMNSVENLPSFGIALLLALLLQASPDWVNWIALIHLASRLGFWAVYYSGVGKVAGGLRTLVFIVSSLTNMAMSVVCLVALIW